MHNEITQKVISRITSEGITPKSRRFFVLRNSVFPVLFLINTIFGAFACATLLFIMTTEDWDVFVYFNRSFMMNLVILFPYIWLFALVVLSSTATYLFRQTRNGYRYSNTTVIGLSVGISISGGVVLFLVGFGGLIHNALLSDIKTYGHIIYTKEDVWAYPSVGLINGTIGTSTPDGFTLTDYSNTQWRIIVTPTTAVDSRTSIRTHEHIKIIGSSTESFVFLAHEIRPWE